jgi:hypothetical protein
MSTLTQVDQQYRSWLSDGPRLLGQVYRTAVELPCPAVTSTEFTQAIILRMQAFYTAQNHLKDFLQKQVSTAAADFFVETVSFFLKIFFASAAPNYGVFSERPIRLKNGAQRPDISIWEANEPRFVIECKTQLGWNRAGWKDQFCEREAMLCSSYPKASARLLVLTSRNWPGFGDDPRVGKQLFVLLNCWPTVVDVKGGHMTQVVHPFERLLQTFLPQVDATNSNRPLAKALIGTPRE